MRLFWLLLIIFPQLLFIGTASAQDRQYAYFERVGSWTIATWQDGKCLAFNRPGKEFNVAPFNALWLIRGPQESDIAIEVFFWPGAFPQGKNTTLEISNDRDITITYDALAVQDYALRTHAAVRYFDIRRLADAPLLHVRTPNVRQELVFDISDLRRVLEHLSACYSVARR